MFKQKSKILFHSTRILVIFLFLMMSNVSYSQAQQSFFWTEQQKIPEYYDFTEEPPYLIADQNFIVHAFNSQPLDLTVSTPQRVVFYRQWSIESGWSFPNDILFDTGGGSIDLLGVSADQVGRVHLVFQANLEDVYYTQTLLVEANSAGAWS